MFSQFLDIQSFVLFLFLPFWLQFSLLALYPRFPGPVHFLSFTSLFIFCLFSCLHPIARCSSVAFFHLRSRVFDLFFFFFHKFLFLSFANIIQFFSSILILFFFFLFFLIIEFLPVLKNNPDSIHLICSLNFYKYKTYLQK